MSTRLVTLLWLLAAALLGLSGDRAVTDPSLSGKVAIAATRAPHILLAHHVLPVGDLSIDAVHAGRHSMHSRPVSGVSKRVLPASDSFIAPHQSFAIPSAPSQRVAATAFFAQNQARAPPVQA